MVETEATSVLDAIWLQAIDDHYWANATPTNFLIAFTVWCAFILIGSTFRSILIYRVAPIVFVTTLVTAYGLATMFEIDGSPLLGLQPPYPYSCEDVILVVGWHAPPCEVNRFMEWAAKALSTRSLTSILEFETSWLCAALCVAAAYALAISISLSGNAAWLIAIPEAAEHDVEASAARSEHRNGPHDCKQCSDQCLPNIHCSGAPHRKLGD